MTRRPILLVLLALAASSALLGQVQITSTSPLPQGYTGVNYSYTFTATVQPPTLTVNWSQITKPSNLPPGLNLSSNGTLSGTPTATGTYVFTVEALAINSSFPPATASFSLTIAAPTVVINTTSPLPNAFQGQLYSVVLSASSNPGGVTWLVGDTRLPPGLNFSSNGDLSGTPTAAGVYTIQLTAEITGTTISTSQSFSLTVYAGQITIQTTTLPQAVSGKTYAATLSATPAGVTWTVNGTLPPGITFNTATGVFGGSSTSVGIYPIQVTASLTNYLSASQNLTLYVITGPLTILQPALPPAVQGSPYTTTVGATGGVAPYQWSFVNGSNLGLSIGSSTGTITGTPTTAGSILLPVMLTDASGTSITANLSLFVANPLSILSATLPNGNGGVAYSQNLSAGGGTAPYSWTIVAGAGGLPPGLSLSTAGTVSGTPTSGGTYTFTVQVTDSGGRTATKALTLSINVTPLVISTTALPNAQLTVPYSQTLSAAGGILPYTWGLASGGLPQGLTLNPTTGVISGTPAGTIGNITFTVQVSDSSLTPLTAQKTLTIGITLTLSITTQSLPSGTKGVAYPSTQILASGGTTPYTWSIASGALPPGLALNSSSGAISGTPTAAGANIFTVTVTDAKGLTASSQLSITINAPAALSITTQSLPNGARGVAYPTTQLAATGGTTPYTWSISSGALPAGLVLNSSSGAIGGTPTATGASTFTVTVTDAAGLTASSQLSITINAQSPALAITTQSLPAGTRGVAYPTTQLAATGGTAPYTWSISSGALPAGLALNSSSGAIGGTPTATGASTFTVTVTDAAGLTASAQFSITITTQTTAVVISNSSLPNGQLNVPYSQTLTAAGGVPPYTWGLASGALPQGLTLNPATGVISGTPAGTIGITTFTVQVSDSSPTPLTAQKAFTVGITLTLTITTQSLPAGTKGIAYPATQLAATGGTTPYTWSIASGALPAGLALNSSSGAIAGTPSAVGANGFTVTVTDAAGLTASSQLSITINAPAALSITTASLPAGTKGSAYPATQLAAAGGTTPYTWSISSGALPAGLALNSSSGAISGTPTATGASTFTAMVTDAAGLMASSQLSITINAPGAVSITTTSLPTGTKGSAYPATQLAAAGGTTPYIWSISSGALPAGLSLTASSGAISGTPTATGASTFTVMVTDAAGLTASSQLSITINAPGAISITTQSLPAGTMGVAYPAAQLAAAGGTTPYTWSIASGTLPAGLSLSSSSGAISGTPTASGSSTFTVTVTDAKGLTASAQFIITINAPGAISITTQSLPAGTMGVAYPAAQLAATGGTTPYTWSIASGTLPAGLSLDSSSGAISGTPTATGASTFTVTVKDSNGLTASAQLSITVSLPQAPSVTIGAVAGTAASQATPSLTLSSAYPLAVTGTLTASFQSAVGGNPTEVGFISSSGGLSSTATFTIAAGGTNAVFANAPALATGTVAGTITLTATLSAGGANITPSPAPAETIPVAPGPPVIETVMFSNTGGGLTVTVIGYSTTREIVSGQFQFYSSTGPILSPVTVQLSSPFSTWYNNSASNQYGSQFTLTIPFTVSGNPSDVVSVNAMLTNTKGESGSLQSVPSN
jgi:hypothetical protein